MAHTNYAENIYWVYTIVLKNSQTAETLMKALKDKGIGSRPFFYGMHNQPVFKKMGLFKNEHYPVADFIASAWVLYSVWFRFRCRSNTIYFSISKSSINLMSIKRIAIFQYDWPLQSYSRDLAIMFTQQGYQVDFLGYNLNVGDFISETSMFQSDLDLIQFSTIETAYLEKNKIFYNVTNKLKFRNYKCRSNHLFNSNHIKIDRKVLLDSYHFIKKNDYAFSIGIEKQGLIWAGLIGEKLNIPTIYYSLELYIEEHPMLQHLGHLRPAEAYFHQQTLATIIQDKSRQKALFEANSV